MYLLTILNKNSDFLDKICVMCTFMNNILLYIG